MSDFLLVAGVVVTWSKIATQKRFLEEFSALNKIKQSRLIAVVDKALYGSIQNWRKWRKLSQVEVLGVKFAAILP